MRTTVCVALALLSGIYALPTGLKQRAKANLNTDAGSTGTSAVFATPYLPDNFEAGQNATSVVIPGWEGPTQHSGFFNFVGERPDASPEINTFFWYLPALNGDPDAPVLLWLQGGPGASSLYGMFTEVGSFNIDENGEAYNRSPEANWNQEYSLLFIDNPVGVGFSFSNDESAYVTDQIQVGADLHAALLQFYQLFPDKRNDGFYVTGESYAGKYIPACAYTIQQRNLVATSDEEKIPLAGISIGDGAMSPPDQFKNYGSLLYYTGMVTSAERKVFDEYEKQIQAHLDEDDLVAAFEAFDVMLNGDFVFPTYYYNVTSMTNYFNFEQGDCGDCAPDYFSDWLVSPATRELIHVGDLPYFDFNETVEVYLKGDWMRGVADSHSKVNMLVPLMEDESVKVLVYSGQNDIILGPPLTEQFLDRLPWAGADAYAASLSTKTPFSVESMKDDPLGGYYQHVEGYGGFTYAVVRGAGHMVPGDQPERAYELITMLVEDTF